MTRRLTPSRLYGDYPAQLAYFTSPLANGCWEFTGFLLPNGYGQLGRNLMAHRIAWEVANGRPVPAGLVVDHTCHNEDHGCHAEDNSCPHRRCVNPAHLEAVTHEVNILRGKGFSPVNAAKTHCAQGHEFTEANTYYRPDRYGRMCRTCRDEALAAGRTRWAERNRVREAQKRRERNPVDFAIREWAQASGLPCSMAGLYHGLTIVQGEPGNVRVSAQIRQYADEERLALYVGPGAEQSSENGQPVLLPAVDARALRDLLNVATARGCL